MSSTGCASRGTRFLLPCPSVRSAQDCSSATPPTPYFARSRASNPCLSPSRLAYALCASNRICALCFFSNLLRSMLSHRTMRGASYAQTTSGRRRWRKCASSVPSSRLRHIQPSCASSRSAVTISPSRLPWHAYRSCDRPTPRTRMMPSSPTLYRRLDTARGSSRRQRNTVSVH